MNRFFIVGNLGQDAELKAFENGSTVINFSVATTEKWKDKQSGEAKEKTEWHHCAKFAKGPQAVAQYLTKGTKVAVEGSITYRNYEKEGQKHTACGLKVDRLELLGSKPGTGTTSSGDDDGLPADPGTDEVPF